jgi:hypothetical protein
VVLIGFYPIDLFAQSATEQPTFSTSVPGISQSPGEPSKPGVSTRSQRTLDLVVTITMATGKAETFAREVDRLEIVTFPDGRIDMVHLLLIAGGERNTHVWYNFSQVAKLSYRFVTPEGRSRVQIRVIQPSAPVQGAADRLEPLGPRDFQ